MNNNLYKNEIPLKIKDNQKSNSAFGEILNAELEKKGIKDECLNRK